MLVPLRRAVFGPLSAPKGPIFGPPYLGLQLPTEFESRFQSSPPALGYQLLVTYLIQHHAVTKEATSFHSSFAYHRITTKYTYIHSAAQYVFTEDVRYFMLLHGLYLVVHY